MYRVAVATSDGISVNEHFGKAKFFRIYEFDDSEYQYIGIRDAVAACQHRRTHNETDFDRVISLLSDCCALFVQKIGEGAAAYLISKNVRVFEVNAEIEPLLKKIIADKLL
ncbi:MAG: dinitrogenase iron-molybdenum cofactor biosynthesis protein [Oscillospiraceae bacterium]|nr:dinitrogenase iron-molybdenum cofactor biosynthesis protein [Oscillospiraceae bacterium]MBQ8780709.1 dinitrogenase iron-molybdenum cofactor biosynthesis protein [Oscillospiraceae bacterium]